MLDEYGPNGFSRESNGRSIYPIEKITFGLQPQGPGHERHFKALLQEEIAIESTVVIEGLGTLTSRLKAGLSFVRERWLLFRSIQAVCQNTLDNYTDEIVHLTAGCSIRVTGVLVGQGKGQSVEIQAEAVEVVGWVDQPESYPSPPNAIRSNTSATSHTCGREQTPSVPSPRNSVSQAIHRYYHENGFFWVNTPIITASDCEAQARCSA